MDRADSDRQGPLASGPAQTIDRAGPVVAAGGAGPGRIERAWSGG